MTFIRSSANTHSKEPSKIPAGDGTHRSIFSNNSKNLKESTTLTSSEDIPSSRIKSSMGIDVSSTGIPSLDTFLHAGLPVPSVMCTQEICGSSSVTSAFSIIKCFIAEGLCSGQNVLYVKCAPDETLDIPSPSSQRQTSESNFSNKQCKQNSTPENLALEENMSELRIAWRYKHMQAPSTQGTAFGDPSSMIFERTFDMGKKISLENIFKSSGAQLELFDPYENCESNHLIETIKNHLIRAKSQNKLLRVIIPSIGSPLWPFSSSSVKLLYHIKQLCMNSKRCILLIKLSPHLLEPTILADLHALSSVVIDISPLQNSKPSTERSNSYSKKSTESYEAIMHIIKPIRTPNSMALMAPVSPTLAISTVKRHLRVEIFNPPPADLTMTSPTSLLEF